jgi:mRNA-degrading endonuclease RelE of RelBE toxin-antitoxin system
MINYPTSELKEIINSPRSHYSQQQRNDAAYVLRVRGMAGSRVIGFRDDGRAKTFNVARKKNQYRPYQKPYTKKQWKRLSPEQQRKIKKRLGL